MKPLVSIIVPLYNRKQLISRCVNSVFGQTYSHWELIIVDDGSTDDPDESLSQLQARDARIRVIRQENGGVSSARNTGLDAAQGEYIQFLDSDDELLPFALAAAVYAMQQSGAEVVAYSWTENTHIDASASEIRFALIEGGERCLAILMQRGLLCAPWNKLWKRSLIGETRFCPGISWGEDFIFNLHVLSTCGRASLLDLQGYLFHADGGGSLSRSYAPTGFDDMLAQGEAIDTILSNCSMEELRVSLLSYLWSCYMQCVRKLCVGSGLPYRDIVAQLYLWNAHPRVIELKHQYAESNKTWVSCLLRRDVIVPVPLIQRLVVRRSSIAAAVRAMQERLFC